MLNVRHKYGYERSPLSVLSIHAICGFLGVYRFSQHGAPTLEIAGGSVANSSRETTIEKVDRKSVV